MLDIKKVYSFNFPTPVRFGAGVIKELGSYLKDNNLCILVQLIYFNRCPNPDKFENDTIQLEVSNLKLICQKQFNFVLA